MAKLISLDPADSSIKQNHIRNFFESFRRFDRFSITFVLSAIVLIAITPFIINNLQTFTQYAGIDTAPSIIKIYASGTSSGGTYPTMILAKDGKLATQWSNIKGNYGPNGNYIGHAEYIYGFSEKVKPEQVSIGFANSAYPDQKRTLTVDKINLDGIDYQTEDPGAYQDGVLLNGKCDKGLLKSEILTCNGYFTYKAAQSKSTELSPTPTCQPRPACLDAEPACLRNEPLEGWCSPSPTPSPVSGPPQISVNPTLISRNGTLTIEWSGISSPHKYDFVTLEGPTTLLLSHGFFINSNNGTCLRSGAEVPASITPKSFGSCTIDLSLESQTLVKDINYYFGLYRAPEVGGQKLADSNTFTITNPISGSPMTISTSYKRVFVTSWEYTGNLGGINGANTKCQNLANNANLGGTWKAWLSDSTNAPQWTWTHISIPYKLLNGSDVASNWSDLIDESLINSISLTDNMIRTKLSRSIWDVWTNTSSSGSIYNSVASLICDNWTSNLPSQTGRGGDSQKNDYWWTSSFMAPQSHTCNALARLYCFEQ